VNNQEALDRYDWLCKKLVLVHRRQWALSHEPLEDHMQVARIGLLQAVKSWSEGKGSSFSSWATTQIRWELQKHDKVDQVRWAKGRDGQRKRLNDLREVPDAAEELNLPKRPLPLYDATGDTTRTEIKLAINELKGEDCLLVLSLMQGHSLTHIAKAFSITRIELQERIEALREKLYITVRGTIAASAVYNKNWNEEGKSRPLN
jgi:RNA polymerase sigma factor (sigma-70 family)